MTDVAARVDMIAPARPSPAAPAEVQAKTAETSGAPVRVGPATPMLAYSYSYGIEAPAGRVAALMQAQRRACEAAGAAACQVVGAQSDAAGRSQVTAKLELRAAPAWLTRFRDGLDADARRFDGRVARTATTSEDLTRQIVDTDAALRAKTLLRDRLTALLATRPGTLSDLVELEQAVAANQGEIDAAQSELAVMRGRVDTSALTIDYFSRGTAVDDSTFAPLGAALKGAVRTLVDGLAALVWTTAFLLPFALVLAGVVWAVRRLRRSAPRRGAAVSAPSS